MTELERQLREALDDLWGCIGHAELSDLALKTIQLARENHNTLWHTPELTIRPTTQMIPGTSDWYGVHVEHCCSTHGCKYGHMLCPVASGKVAQGYPCETCDV